MILVDSNILFDLWDRDPTWSAWSSGQLRGLAGRDELAINPVIYAEVSARFSTHARLDQALTELEVLVLDVPREAAFLAGKAFVQYWQSGGGKGNVLPDFFIGAHAKVLKCPLITRDTRKYATYFPSVALIAP